MSATVVSTSATDLNIKELNLINILKKRDKSQVIWNHHAFLFICQAAIVLTGNSLGARFVIQMELVLH